MTSMEVGIGPHLDEPDLPPEIGGWAPEVTEEEERQLPVAYDEYTGMQLDGESVVGARGNEVE